MTDLERQALLPTGLRDILPPEAAFEAEICETLAAKFGSHGYDRVKPPLVERIVKDPLETLRQIITRNLNFFTDIKK